MSWSYQIKRIFMKRYIKIYVLKIIIIFLLIIVLILKKIKKVGIIGVRHEVNVGNNLIKYAISIKLSELGFIPYIIGTHLDNYNISFIQNKTNCVIIKNNFSEIKEKDYDILMVNSDQTWRRFDEHFYDYGFLKFAKNWKIPKFIYGASLGYDFWTLTKEDEIIIKELINQFSGISVREKGSIKLIKKHLGIEPLFVLDPTFLINKDYYLDLIKNYKKNININDDFIFTYFIIKENNTNEFIEKACTKLGYKNYHVEMNKINSIEEFIYGINNSKAVITNSFHGTIFSIMFKKPFVTFIFKNSPRERLISLKNVFHLEDRIFEFNQTPNINLLTTPININETLINLLKNQSIYFLKKNLGLIK